MGDRARATAPSIDDRRGQGIPAVYHGGSVMRNVTIHTIFWAPTGYRFDGSPAAVRWATRH